VDLLALGSSHLNRLWPLLQTGTARLRLYFHGLTMVVRKGRSGRRGCSDQMVHRVVLRRPELWGHHQITLPLSVRLMLVDQGQSRLQF